MLYASGARAALFSGGAAVSSNTLTTITLINTSGSTVAANSSVSQRIGCPFKKGDITSGTWPQFQATDGTPCKVTICDKLATFWKDGSLKSVPVLLMYPKSMTAGASATVNVLSGGSLPAASSRGTADLTNGIAPQIQVDGLDNLSGTWIADLSQAIPANIKIITYGNGDCGWCGKIRANFRQSGSDHGQFVADCYVDALANSDGTLRGIRFLGKLKLPYYNGTGAKNWVSFSRVELRSDASTVIRDCLGSNFGATRARTFTAGAGASITSTHGYANTNGGDYGYLVRLSSTGTLPPGFALNTSYFTYLPGNTSTTMNFCTNSQNPSGHTVAAGGAGSGTHTWTPYPYLCYFGGIFTAGPTGKQDWIQGAGSDNADTPLRHQVAQAYWLSTKTLPPYDLSIGTVTSNNSFSYWPNCAGPVVRNLETTGERDDIGVMPAWYARHFFTQAAVDEQVVRITSLVGGHFTVGIESSATLAYPCVNNGSDNAGASYSGMSAPNPLFRCQPGAFTGAFGAGNTDTTVASVQLEGFSGQDTTHMPQFNYYAYLFFGDPWHLDTLTEHANSAVYWRNGATGNSNISPTNFALGTSGSGVRNLKVGSNPTRYGAIVGCATVSQRADAWGKNLVCTVAGIMPAVSPDCAGYSAYFPDNAKATGLAEVDIINELNANGVTYGYANGLWSAPWQQTWPIVDHWMMLGYHVGASSLAAALTEDTNILASLGRECLWADKVVGTFGGYHIGCEQTVMRTAITEGAPLATDDSTIAFIGPVLSWSSGTQLFTNSGCASNNSVQYVAQNGDRVVFVDSVASDGKVTPAGFSKYVGYYVVNASGTVAGVTNTFQLSATLGGSPLTLADSYSGGDSFYAWSSAKPATGSMSAMSITGTNTVVRGSLAMATAIGAGPLAGTLADLVARDVAFGIPALYVGDPKWAMKSAYV